MKRQATILAIARLLSAAFQAVGFLILVNAMSIVDFGIFSIILGINQALLGISAFGITTFIIREYTLGNHQYLRPAFKFNGWTTFLASALAILAALFFAFYSLEIAVAGVIVALATATEKPLDLRTSLFIAQKRTLTPVALIISRPLVSTVLLISLLPYLGAAVAYAIGKLSAGSLTLLIGIKQTQHPTPNEHVGLRELASKLAPLGITGALGTVRTLDVALAGIAGGPAVSGIYSAATRLTQPFLIAANAASSVLMRHSALASSTETHKNNKQITLLIVSLIALILLSLPLFNDLIGLLFPDEYSAYVLVFVLLTINIPLRTGSILFATVLQARGHERYVLMNTTINTLGTLSGVTLGALFAGSIGVALGVTLFSLGSFCSVGWKAWKLTS